MNCPHCQASNAAHEGPCFECGQALTPVAGTARITKGSLVANRYEVLDVLGRGGMGVVYKAHDRLLDEAVAIKVLRRELIANPESAQRFRIEIKLARRVSHPNVCRIHEYGEDGELSYISMAFVEGSDLRRRLAEFKGGLPAEEAFDVAIQAARGLQAIHDAGVVHRDFKTPNIMREPGGAIRLMDFGIAKASDQHGRGLTATGMVVGTPEFMSPEQCRGQPLDARSDIYSLGVVTFELFTGHVPFQADSLVATLMKQLEEPPPLEGAGSERLPPSLIPVLRKALAKSPDARYPRALDVALALAQAREQMHAAGAAQASVSVPTPPPASAPPSQAPTAPVERPERRASTRLELPLDVSLEQLGPQGAVLLRERTLADNICRNGLRVMTALNSIELNDSVSIQEVHGDLRAQARVRHRFQAGDGIWRLGLEFIDGVAPDRLVRTGEWTSSVAGRPHPSGGTAVRAAAARAAPSPAPGPTLQSLRPPARPERRSSSRLRIPLELTLERLGTTGQPVHHERTLAENVSRGGAQVLTAMASLTVGEIVRLTEVSGDFQARAAVRSAHSGPDRIRRLNLEFLDRQAPDRLVPAADSGTPRQHKRAGASPVPAPATPDGALPPVAGRREVLELFGSLKGRSHYDVLGLSRGASETEIREAYMGLVKRFHPDTLQAAGFKELKTELSAILARVAEAYQVLSDAQRRAAYEAFLGPLRRPVASPAPAPPRTEPPTARDEPEPPRELPPLSPQDTPPPRLESVEPVLRRAHELIKQEKYWDAVQELEGAVPRAPSPAQRHLLQLLLARTMLRNEKWLRRAEDLLLTVTGEDPRCVEALMLLAAIYRDRGLRTRAERLLRQVLELDPGHDAAAGELKNLAGRPPRRFGL